MLELRHITKSYTTETLHQVALNDASVAFRDTEFVSILGPSGSGKTTLLNIIGGLDKYDSGDLIINGVSTKEYNDRDWDTYRNHSIGFVFQSYNLIGHQSVLSNVEMALTLSGVAKSKRKKMAVEALKRVGLEEHIHKKPNQLSGGQMQRVAIARALVNNPDIILADEPTGALDSDTSVQIMNLLKEISKDKLVIMVTHNPELAEEYSTRIVKVKDGRIIGDTNPFTPDKELKGEKPKKKTSMNFLTALSLSFNNLLTKKGRTILTSFAGSIGIIGIALILAISTGVNNYIDDIQKDTLSSFPIQIEKETTDMTALMGSLMLGNTSLMEGEDVSDRDGVYANPVMYRMMSSLFNAEVNTNNLEKFKEYLDKNKDELNNYATAIQYGYDIDLNIYAKDSTGMYAKADFTDLMQSVIDGSSMINAMTSMMGDKGGINIWQELLTDPSTGEISNLVTEQYDLLYGKWPSKENEIVLVLTEANEISDITLYSLGLVDRQTMINSTMAALMGKEDTSFDEYIGKSWSYEDICKIKLKMVLPTDYYQYDESTKLWVDISGNQALLDSVIGNGMDLNIVGIIKPSEDATSPFLSGSLCYTPALTNYYINAVNSSQIVQDQKKNTEINLITGLPFVLEETEELTNEAKIQAFKDYVAGLTDNEKAKLYERILATPNAEFVQETVNKLLEQYKDKTAEEIVKDIKEQYAGELGYSEELIDSMLTGYDKEALIELLDTTVREMIITHYQENAKRAIEEISGRPSMEELAQIKAMIMAEMYSSMESLPANQQAIAKYQINIGFVARSWSTMTGMSIEAASQYLASLSSNEFELLLDSALTATATTMYSDVAGMGSNSANAQKVAKAFDEYLANSTDEDFLYFYNNHMPDKVSDKTHDDLLDTLGVATLDDPSFIYIYPIDFEMKENIAKMIDTYNQSATEDDQIEYTDIAAMLMSSVSSIITAISVVLICFVSISLVVSSIMIGIITYISVLERTKEIGILRAVGASKKDIARVFNAETMIVGLLAGLVGIVATLLLCIPISMIARYATGIQSLTAVLPWYGYLLIVLSVALTMIAGLFPSKMAAKKDPVIALRTE
jgi:ABC-type lipoprotein export system ATPase subunit